MNDVVSTEPPLETDTVKAESAATKAGVPVRAVHVSTESEVHVKGSEFYNDPDDLKPLT